MNDETKREEPAPGENGSAEDADVTSAGPDSSSEEPERAANGPTFTEAPDPLSGVRRTLSGILASMDGKTVSMKTYVGTIIGVVVLMMLARCGG